MNNEAKERVEKARWVPVSERLPEKSDEYIASIRLASGIDLVLELEWSNTFQDWYHDDHSDFIVTAWMPFPEPYREAKK